MRRSVLSVLLLGTVCFAPSCADVFGLEELELKAPPDASLQDGGDEGNAAGAGGAAGDASLEADVSSADGSLDVLADGDAADGKDAAVESDAAGQGGSDADAADEADAEAGPECPIGKKMCSGSCVPVDQPTTGCGAASCDACALPNASAMCDSSLQCAIQQCVNGWDDCNATAADGCEVMTKTEPDNCGGCGMKCAPAHASPQCLNGSCSIASCDPGWLNCNGLAADGCEIDSAADPMNCGACGSECSFAHAQALCQAGGCAMGTCAAQYEDCDGDASNGCEALLQSDPDHCGTCENACNPDGGTLVCTSGQCVVTTCPTGTGECDDSLATPCETDLTTNASNCGYCGNVCQLSNATPGCVASQCEIVGCLSPYGNCDNNESNGCETNLTTSLQNCGQCGTGCSAAANALPTCNGGACGISCVTGYGDCDGTITNGCETSLLNSKAHCGACNVLCSSYPNSTSSCTAGQCGFSCDSGFADCDKVVGNGCEANLLSSVSNCGACGTLCSMVHGTPSCLAGVCTISCNSGWANCDGNADDGCETSLTTLTDCGACGSSCANPNGTTSCATGACIPSCAATYADCDGNPNNGCETSTASLNNCGGCGLPCWLPNAVASCATGTCSFSACSSGWGNCDGNTANGCETNTSTNASHCGSCGAPCSNANGSPSCAGGTCSITCNANWGNCNGDVSDGCETSLVSDVQHCGNCASVCSFPHAAALCSSGSCQLGACSAGWGDCDGAPGNGCEKDLKTLTDCGTCGIVCSMPNATASCSSGTCAIAACNSGFGDCDGVASTGCETNLTASTAHCGKCGSPCSSANGAASCTGGMCSISCSTGFADCDNNLANGCEAALNTTSNCGSCGSGCLNDHGVTSCISGACSPSCASGYGNCDGNLANGCETDTQTSSGSCGTCGTACTNSNGITSCVAGVCKPVCASGFGSCDSNPNNGCETPTTTVSNCGSCGVACANPNGTTACVSGACVPTCGAGFDNCDGNAANGCETNTNSSVSHCKTCGSACSCPSGTPKCVNGVCGCENCAAGLADCDGSSQNGCETSLTTLTDCGGCGTVCAPANATASCATGACVISACDVGFGNCDANAANGCETITSNNLSSCGACGNVCSTPANATPSCAAGVCGFSCSAGFADCDASAVTGCEANLLTSTTHCGACGKACSANHGVASCTGGVCSIVCASGWADCDGQADNGCETSLATVTDCGTCGALCANPNGTTACVSGLCSPTCAGGFASCDGNAANGCETSTHTLTDCGGCGVACWFPNGTASCSTGTCTFGACSSGWGNCDNNTTNGCETNTSSNTSHCGACGVVCNSTNGAATCSNGTCSITCNSGWGNCDGDAANGCEKDLSADPLHCGTCSTVCSYAHATPQCVASKCQMGACSSGWGNCDGTTTTGCEKDLRTLTDCGSCGAACNLANATSTCDTGTCQIASCNTGFANCDGQVSTGCEANTQTSTSHCGGCGQACSSANGAASCNSGVCSITCSSGYGNCDNDVANGCESSLSTAAHCGTCAKSCSNAHGVTSCLAGACSPSCASGYGDCDGNPDNGCETDTQSTTAHCAACGTVCSNSNGTTSCVAGVCVPSCASGFGDCDANPRNGCETAIDTVSNCGACGTACSNTNGGTTCTSGACVPSCASGYGNCDANPNNGCETNVNSNVNHCAICGHVCDCPSGTPSCSAGVCGCASCATGTGNCDGDVSNGCETSLTTLTNCGACGVACSRANATPTCASGTCELDSCNSGYGDCDGNTANGCETVTQNNLSNCGTCGTVCSARPNSTTQCNAGTCGFACSAGFGDCNAVATDGCESVLATDTSNCGTCGNVCSANHGTASCSAGACQIACSPGFANCDGKVATGCETDITTTTNCGACGTVCSNGNGSTSCVGAVCSPSCATGYASCDSNPNNGCETSTRTLTDCGTCAAACSFPNAAASCATGTCVFGACSAGWGNCDGNTLNGCETNTSTSVSHCGACGAACNSTNGVASCTSGSCAIACNTGWGNCDSNLNNGCEADLSADVQHCGTCTTVCSYAHAAASCFGGACQLGACSTGWGNCDSNAATGCETALDTLTNCGTCGAVCSLANATPTCSTGTCAIGTCSAGFGNCDGLQSTGCETNTLTDTLHCGGCGAACNATNGTPSCSGGACAIACNTGFGNCDNNAATGCEAPLNTTTNCGACGAACNNSNGSTSCVAGVCTPTCSPGFADCDGNPANGCETNTQTNVNNCSVCGNKCTNDHGSTSCVAGVCTPVCTGAYGNCDGNPGNGCETPTDTVANCGACGAACSNLNGSTDCVSGACVPSCTTGFGDCDAVPSNGCETATSSNVNHCGTCTTACTCPSGTPSCVNSVCDCTSCNPGLGNCDGQTSNGCETSLTTLTDCGACGVACSRQNATPSCATGTCTIASCNSGYQSCDGQDANGCEVNTQADVLNCGVCSNSCSTVHGTPSCVTGACNISCTAGWGNCDSNVGNGCETDTTTTTAHCGSCATACVNSNGSTSCSAGVCAPVCNPNYASCDGNPVNGCETYTQTSAANCGACGHACTNAHGSALCVLGACASICDPGYSSCDGSFDNGCETNTNTDTAHCGDCTTACTNANGSTSCVAGVCTPVCNTGFGNCDGSVSNGCETPLNTTSNCGTCGNVCSSVHGTPGCMGTACTIACSAGYADCDVQVSNGCETDLATVTDCGGCGIACSNPHGTTACKTGLCDPKCDAGYGSCDGSLVNGCETALLTDVQNCGTCGNACSLPHAVATCTAGACAIASCVPGWADCDLNAANGCEKPLDTLTDCGACGIPCARANATATCDTGSCHVASCNTNWADCDAIDLTGCETNVQTSLGNCGSCGAACTNLNGSTQCVAGVCTPSCSLGYGDCDSNANNGCETPLNTATNCGTCGTPCAPAHALTSTCLSRTCVFTCETGWADCNSSATDGCEANLDTNVNNCGACGRACVATNVQGKACSGGKCTSTCAIGWGNCSLPNSGSADNGCERNVTADNNNCGSCGTKCANGFVCNGGTRPQNNCGCDSNPDCGSGGTCNNATGVCTCNAHLCERGEACSPAGGCSCNDGNHCAAGQTCCPGAASNCIDLTSNAANCGVCGRACLPGFTCESSSCKCTSDGQCNAGTAGTCTSGACVCSSQTCAYGKRCLPDGSCG